MFSDHDKMQYAIHNIVVHVFQGGLHNMYIVRGWVDSVAIWKQSNLYNYDIIIALLYIYQGHYVRDSSNWMSLTEWSKHSSSVSSLDSNGISLQQVCLPQNWVWSGDLHVYHFLLYIQHGDTATIYNIWLGQSQSMKINLWLWLSQEIFAWLYIIK